MLLSDEKMSFYVNLSSSSQQHATLRGVMVELQKSICWFKSKKGEMNH